MIGSSRCVSRPKYWWVISQARETFPVYRGMALEDFLRQCFHRLSEFHKRVLHRPEAHAVGVRECTGRR
jgi:hypothetical protein